MPRTLSLLLLLAPALLVACASSPEPSGAAARVFAAMDTDGDKVVTEAEVEQLADRRFRRADVDGDNRLDFDELAAAERDSVLNPRNRVRNGGSGGRVGGIAGGLAASDRDGDGRLDRAEFADRSLRMFDRLDRNRDGRITKDEMARTQDAMRERRQR